MGKDREQQEVLPLADEFKKLFSMHAPKWTSDSSFNRVHWLNRVIDAIMATHIDTGVSRTVKESVEPTLRELAPSCVTWIGFEKFTLGPRAPTLSGIRSHNSHMENADFGTSRGAAWSRIAKSSRWRFFCGVCRSR